MKMYKTVSSNNIEWVRVNDEEYCNLYGITEDIQNVKVMYWENEDVTKVRLTNVETGEDIETEIPTSKTLKQMILESLDEQGIEVS